MKRYVCSAVAGLLLALASAAPAAANGLPAVGQATGQSGTQVSSLGDQSVGEQSATADVTQKQGNGNVNVAPAVSVFGDAESGNEQGNDNKAVAKVDQENEVEQSQSSEQEQSLSQSGSEQGCCAGRSQSGEQKHYAGDQSVGSQSNDATVEQWQGNGNVNVSPAVSVFGDAKTWNEQGNGNVAYAGVEQENEVEQSQTSNQEQSLEQSGGSEKVCCAGQSQSSEQKTAFGDQSVKEQSNSADVTQKQGNGNANVSPAISLLGGKGSCKSECGKPSHVWGGDAESGNEQGNDNKAVAKVDQGNEVEQSQSSEQEQSLSQSGSEQGCCAGRSQSGEQRTYGGDQSVGSQLNDATVSQWQGNGNVNVSPAVSVFGDAKTWNEQGNGNVAYAGVEQGNEVEQSQASNQEQSLAQTGGDCCEPRHDDRPTCEWKKDDDRNGHGKPSSGKPSYDDSRPGKDDRGKGHGKPSYDDRERCEKSDRKPLHGTNPWSHHPGRGHDDDKPSFSGSKPSSGWSGPEHRHDCGPVWHPAKPKACDRWDCKDDRRKPGDDCHGPTLDHGKLPYGGCPKPCGYRDDGCEPEQEQAGEQKVLFGDQAVGEQSNAADVTQKQGNGNLNVAPAVSVFDDAETENEQGNGSVAVATLDQENEVEQSQVASQVQTLSQEVATG